MCSRLLSDGYIASFRGVGTDGQDCGRQGRGGVNKWVSIILIYSFYKAFSASVPPAMSSTG